MSKENFRQAYKDSRVDAWNGDDDGERTFELVIDLRSANKAGQALEDNGEINHKLIATSSNSYEANDRVPDDELEDLGYEIDDQFRRWDIPLTDYQIRIH